MNRIIDARRESAIDEIATKSFELLVADKFTVVIPPLNKYSSSRINCIRIVFENALLPVSEVLSVPDDEGEIYAAAALALKYFNGETPKKDLILSALGDLLAGFIAAFTSKREYSPVVETVRTEIAKGVSDCGFSLKACLKKLPLNYDYIRKLFKKEVGVTPADYLLKERMALAKQLLTSGVSNKFSPYSISQIAEACGYSEPLYFSRVFKKYYGVSPSEYK